MKQLLDVVVNSLFIHEMPVHEINYTLKHIVWAQQPKKINTVQRFASI